MTKKELIIEAFKNENYLNPTEFLIITKQNKILIPENRTVFIDQYMPYYKKIQTFKKSLTKIINESKNPLIRNNFDTSKLKNFYMFFINHDFYKFPMNINNLNTKKMETIQDGFVQSKLTDDVNISQWDTKNLMNMESTFEYIPYFNQNLSTWYTKKIKTLKLGFSNIKKFKGNLNNLTFNNLPYLYRTFANSNQNVNFNTWKFPDNEPIVCTKKCFHNCKKQKNSFYKWDFARIYKKYKSITFAFKNCPQIIPTSKNWYTLDPNTTMITSVFKTSIEKHNIIPYIKKYVSKTNIPTYKNFIKNELGILYQENKKSKYKKNYIQFCKQ